MGSSPTEIRLTLNPTRRFEAIDVNRKIADETGDLLARYRKTLYCSLHTTAGYLDQSLAGRMHHHHGRLAQFFDAWHALFPQHADYRHDQMELRSELSDQQKEVEPRNGDSHLTFIGSGMRNCVTLPQPAGGARLLHRPRRHERREVPAAADHDRGVRRGEGRHPRVVPGPDQPPPDRLGEPRRPADRTRRARPGPARPQRAREGPGGPLASRRSSAASASRSTSTRRS